MATEAPQSNATPQELTLHVCGPCNYHGTTRNATNFCEECIEFLCPDCTVSHIGFTSFRNHSILREDEVRARDDENAGAGVVLCDCGKKLEVTAYCEDHDVVLCQPCKAVKHAKCKTETTRKKGSGYGEMQLRSVVQKVSKLEKEIETFLHGRNVDLQELSTLRENCKLEIKTFRQEIKNHLDKMDLELNTELDECDAIERHEIEQQISKCTMTKQLLDLDTKLLYDAKNLGQKHKMFAAHVKLMNRLKEYDNIMLDIYKERKSPMLAFNRNEELEEFQANVVKLGTLTVNDYMSSKVKPTSFVDLTVDNYKTVNIKIKDDKQTPWITGIVCLPDGQVVLCDRQNKKIKRLSSKFIPNGSVDVENDPWDVAQLDDKNVIVAFLNGKQLQVIQVTPKLETGRVIQLEKGCFGVEVYKDEIYVTCPGEGTDGNVRVLDMDGHWKRTFVTQAGLNTFKLNSPYYLKLCTATGNIIVSDPTLNTLTCLKPDGSIQYQCKEKGDGDLRGLRGICVDAENNIIVCDIEANSVIAVTDNGTIQKPLLTTSDNMKQPCSITFRQADSTLFVGCCLSNALFVCTMKQQDNMVGSDRRLSIASVR